MRFLLPIAISVLAIACVRGADLPLKPDLRDVVHAVRPAYPYVARLHHLEGYGVYALQVRADGSVSSVTIVRSTAHKILDDYAVRAFAQWRFRAGRKRTVNEPITFTMQGRRE